MGQATGVIAILMAACAAAGCGQGGAGGADANAAEAGAAPSAQQAAAADAVARGRYLVAIMDCAGCHNKGSFSPKPEEGYLEGGAVGFEVPGLGVFWPPNLTPHPQAGLGAWSEADIVRALKTGTRPDGRQLSPAMPWPAYSKLSDADVRAVAAYLKSLPPSPNQVPAPAQPAQAKAPYMTVKAPSPAA